MYSGEIFLFLSGDLRFLLGDQLRERVSLLLLGDRLLTGGDLFLGGDLLLLGDRFLWGDLLFACILLLFGDLLLSRERA